MSLHTGVFFCCQCCEGLATVHCCGACCTGSELGWGVQRVLHCSHPCVKGVKRHDTSIVKKVRVKGRSVVDEGWDSMPKGGVGKWSCCGAGSMVATCTPAAPSSPPPTPQYPHSVSPVPTMPTPATMPSEQPLLPPIQTQVQPVPQMRSPTTLLQSQPQALRTISPVPYHDPSSLCEECGLDEATLWCTNCEALFCALHFKLTHSSKVGSRHVSLAINYKPSACEEHAGQRAILHCLECKKDVCRICCCTPMFGVHSKHNVVTLGEAEANAALELKSKLAISNERRNELEAGVAKVGEEKRFAKEMMERARLTVNKEFSKFTAAIFREIERRKSEVLGELDEASVPVIASLMTTEVAMSRAALACREACDTTTAVLSSHRALKLKDNLITLLEGAEASTAAVATQPSLPRLGVKTLFPDDGTLTHISEKIAGFGKLEIEKHVQGGQGDTRGSTPKKIVHTVSAQRSDHADHEPARQESPTGDKQNTQDDKFAPEPEPEPEPAVEPEPEPVLIPEPEPVEQEVSKVVVDEASFEVAVREEALLRDAVALAEGTARALVVQCAVMEHKVTVQKEKDRELVAEPIERDTPSPAARSEDSCKSSCSPKKSPEPEQEPEPEEEEDRVQTLSPVEEDTKEEDQDQDQDQDQGTTPEKHSDPEKPKEDKPTVLWCSFCNYENETSPCELCGTECILKEEQ